MREHLADSSTAAKAKVRPGRPASCAPSPALALPLPGRLSAASVLVLQRTIGNAALTRLLSSVPGQRATGISDAQATASARRGEPTVVQRYIDIDPGDENYPGKYHIGSRKGARNADDDDSFFASQHKTQEGSYFADAETRTANIAYKGSVRLRFSDNFDLAVEHETGEAKFFFATEKHIVAANIALAGRADDERAKRVQFHKGTRFLRLRDERGTPKPDLYQVEPMVETRTERTGLARMLGKTKTTTVTGLSIRTPQNCDAMAKFVSRKADVVGDGHRASSKSLSKVLDMVMSKIPGLVEESKIPGLVSETLGTGEESASTPGLEALEEAFWDSGKTDAYLEYLNELSRIFQNLKADRKGSRWLDEALQELALNEFLPAPSPGSVLATFGQGDEDQEERGEDETFPYHFGTVVATSGGDYVTMENYARRDPIVGNNTAGGDDPLFFFKMYGTDLKGDTWHSVQEGTGSFIGAILSVTLQG